MDGDIFHKAVKGVKRVEAEPEQGLAGWQAASTRVPTFSSLYLVRIPKTVPDHPAGFLPNKDLPYLPYLPYLHRPYLRLVGTSS